MCQSSTAFTTGELETCCNYGLLFSAVMRFFLHDDFHQANTASMLHNCDLKTRTAAINVYRAYSISTAKNDGHTLVKKKCIASLSKFIL